VKKEDRFLCVFWGGASQLVLHPIDCLSWSMASRWERIRGLCLRFCLLSIGIMLRWVLHCCSSIIPMCLTRILRHIALAVTCPVPTGDQTCSAHAGAVDSYWRGRSIATFEQWFHERWSTARGAKGLWLLCFLAPSYYFLYPALSSSKLL
jgi:hypothetical protein